jgi:hypothetical protein
MNKETIQEKIDRAIERLIEDDLFLLDTNVNERSITHQLAVYLAGEFTGYDYDIDCEYNRMFKDGQQAQKKSIPIEEMEKVSIGDISAKTVYPDNQHSTFNFDLRREQAFNPSSPRLCRTGIESRRTRDGS